MLDINLGPGGSGLTVGRELHARGVTILYASGSCSDHLSEMEQTGARAYLSKPYYPDEVPSALNAVDLLRVGMLPRCVPPAFHVLA